MKNKKNILIVGGTGFIGSNLVQKAIKLNYKVYSLSKNKYKKKINKVTYITLDLKKKKKLFEVINSINFEYVIYSSGYIQHKDFNIEGFAYINENINNFNNLIETINLNHVKKFLNICSSDEYGVSTAPQKESSIKVPTTPYALLKNYNSSLLKSLNLKKKLNYLNVYTFLVYGPGQKLDRFIPALINTLLQNKTFLLKSPKYNRDFIYIDDYTDIIFKCLKSKKTTNMDINIGSGKIINLQMVAQNIYSKINLGKLKILKTKSKKDKIYNLYPNLYKMKFLFKKWKPKYNIDYGLNLTIDYYKTLK